jgi:hypothetical protein
MEKLRTAIKIIYIGITFVIILCHAMYFLIISGAPLEFIPEIIVKICYFVYFPSIAFGNSGYEDAVNINFMFAGIISIVLWTLILYLSLLLLRKGGFGLARR